VNTATPELLPQDGTYTDWQRRDAQRQNLASLGVQATQGAIIEPLADNNNWLAPAAGFKATAYPATTRKARTAVTGVPGSQVSTLTVTGSTILTGMRIRGLVTVEATGILIAQNCRFDSGVTVAAGGRGHFIGSLTQGVTNAGLATNVFIIGCHRESGAYFGCTVIAATA